MTAVALHQPLRLVTVSVDGESLLLTENMMLATALSIAGIVLLRRSPKAEGPRGAFCLMGACQECAIHVDGVIRQACMTPVRAGMDVELRGVP